jgi:hypothetical protein
MYKTIALLFLVIVGGAASDVGKLKFQSSHIHRDVSTLNRLNNGLDWCPQCIDTFDDLIQVVLNIILDYGVMDTCGHLCDIVGEKTGSGLLEFICTMGCDVLGLEEFVKLMQKADIDPIYYCETINLCPSKSNKFYSKFKILLYSK